MDFEEAERSEPTQALELGPDDIKEDGIIQLRYVKFQNVNSVTVSPFSLREHRNCLGGASVNINKLILIQLPVRSQ